MRLYSDQMEDIKDVEAAAAAAAAGAGGAGVVSASGTGSLGAGGRGGAGMPGGPAGLQYSIPGILHFLQHEWARFEMERGQWDVEKAELQVSTTIERHNFGLRIFKNCFIPPK